MYIKTSDHNFIKIYTYEILFELIYDIELENQKNSQRSTIKCYKISSMN